MIIPDKFTPLAESTLGKVDRILSRITGRIDILQLFHDLADAENFGEFTVEEFIYEVELLYLLGLVNVDLRKGVIDRAR